MLKHQERLVWQSYGNIPSFFTATVVKNTLKFFLRENKGNLYRSGYLDIGSLLPYCFANLWLWVFVRLWFIWKAISNSLISVLSDIWTPRRWSLKPLLCFVNPLLGVWICRWDETLRSVFLTNFDAPVEEPYVFINALNVVNWRFPIVKSTYIRRGQPFLFLPLHKSTPIKRLLTINLS